MVATVIIALIVIAVVFIVAAAMIGRESSLLGQREYRPTYRLPDAVVYVADRLDPEHAGQLTYDELGELLKTHIDILQGQAELGVGAEAPVVTDDPGVVAIAEAATHAGIDVRLDTIMVVMSRQLDYLRELGALEAIEQLPPADDA